MAKAIRLLSCPDLGWANRAAIGRVELGRIQAIPTIGASPQLAGVPPSHTAWGAVATARTRRYAQSRHTALLVPAALYLTEGTLNRLPL